MVATGLAVAIPEGHAGFVQPRSGLAARHGIAVVNSPAIGVDVQMLGVEVADVRTASGGFWGPGLRERSYHWVGGQAAVARSTMTATSGCSLTSVTG
jgi:hypothetical protein